MDNYVKSILDSAHSFVIGANRCLEQRPLGSGRFELPIVPAIVCGAFAIELYFKALFKIETDTMAKKEHDLSILFSHLSQASQVKIRTQLTLEEIDFQMKLNEIAKAFEEWRYNFESEGIRHASTAFIMNLANASKELAEDMVEA